MNETDELDLGLPPSTKRKRTGTPKPVEGIEWSIYTVKDRPFCDDCLSEVPKVNGVPVHAVSLAFHKRRSGTETGYFCGKHHQHRLLEEGRGGA